MVLEEPLLVGRQVSVLVRKNQVCFQIQEIVFHLSILLRRLWRHLVQQRGMNLSLWGFWISESKVEWKVSESFWSRDTFFCIISISWDISYWNSKWSYHIRRFSKCFISWDFISSILSNIISSFVWAFDSSSVCKCSTCGIAEIFKRDVWCWKYFDTARTSFERSFEDGRILWGIFKWPSVWNFFWKYSLWESRS